MRRHFEKLLPSLRAIAGHHLLQLSAAVSYYTLLSLAPIVLVAISVAGLAFGREAVQGRVVEEIRGLVGESGAEVIQSVIQNASEPGTSALSLVIGILLLLVGASTVFVQLQDALNQIWSVEAKPKRNAVWSFVKDRLLSAAMVLGIGFLLLVSLLVNAGLSAWSGWVASRGSAEFPILMQILNIVVSFGVITLLFAMIFRFLPDVRLAWRDVWFGAMVTAALFGGGKYAIGLYLGRASIGSAYGAAGSVVVLLVWVYYAALILFIGAEITRIRASRKAAPVEANPAASVTPRPTGA
jgi:membrane protein